MHNLSAGGTRKQVAKGMQCLKAINHSAWLMKER
jgi:hypothetical protein